MACTERPSVLLSFRSVERSLAVIRASSALSSTYSLVPSVGLELPIITSHLPCAKTPPCRRVLLPPAELTFPHNLGALSSAHRRRISCGMRADLTSSDA